MKTLVYYTLGCSRDYITMLDISYKSLRKVYSGDIGIICDVSFVDECQKRFPDTRIWSVPDSNTGSVASMNKLKIFDFITDYEYDSVLYLDTDILIIQSLQPYFDKFINPDLLYVYTERDNIEDNKHIFWSLNTYTEEDYSFLKDNRILPFNAGTFGFIPSSEMREHFNAVRNMIQIHKGNYFYEQSFMNVYFNLHNNTDRSVFTKDNYIFTQHKPVYPNGILIHFADASISGQKKCHNMLNYINIMNKHTFTTRNEMLSLVPKHGTYAEIGVFKGEFSDIISKTLQPKQLVLIDLFEGIVGSGDQDGNNMQNINISEVYNHLLNVSKKYPALTVLKGDSVTQLHTFPDETFDMIYLDGDHSYNGVKRDLEVSFLKVKNEGWIMGHDYEINFQKTNNYYDFGVKQAVDEFCVQYNQTIYAKALDGCVSFAIYVIKKTNLINNIVLPE